MTDKLLVLFRYVNIYYQDLITAIQMCLLSQFIKQKNMTGRAAPLTGLDEMTITVNYQAG